MIKKFPSVWRKCQKIADGIFLTHTVNRISRKCTNFKTV